MVLPDQEQVDLRASCFSHKKIIDIGYVCSVCLSGNEIFNSIYILII